MVDIYPTLKALRERGLGATEGYVDPRLPLEARRCDMCGIVIPSRRSHGRTCSPFCADAARRSGRYKVAAAAKARAERAT